jgi:hypothetical protein
MVARRRKTRRRSKKTFSINLIETGAGLAFLDAANAGTAAQALLRGNVKGGLDTLTSAFKTNGKQMVTIGAGALAMKLIARSFAGNGSTILGKIGPIALRA